MRHYDVGACPSTQTDPIGLAGGLNLYGYADGDPINKSDPFGLMACPPCGFEGDPKNVEREVQMFEARTPRDNLAMLAIAGAGVAASVGLASVSARLMGAAAAMAPAVGATTMRMVDAIQRAGPDIDARMSAVMQTLPRGFKGITTTLEGGAQMLQGGAGQNLRQFIFNPDGTTVLKAFNVATKSLEVVREIVPK